MFEYFYNEIFRSVIIGFGSMFNGIEIEHKNESDNTVSTLRVPLAYGPTQKFLARIEQQANLNKGTQMSLPRMSFEFTDLQYDPTRKSTQTQQFVVKNSTGSEIKKGYVPVPYNMTIQLSIMTKLNDDMLQIVEQILPYFQPSYNLPINFLGDFKEKRDIPIQLEGISMEDDYEGNFETRRALVYTLTFTAKTFLFGPLSDVSGDIIKKVTVGYVSGSAGPGLRNPERDLTYRVVPRAVQDYDDSYVTTISENVGIEEKVIEVADASQLSAASYIQIGKEEMYIEKVSGNKLTVKRGQDTSTVAEHVLGSGVATITAADNNLIEIGDDFGFDGTVF
mgnify:FL=1|tara:strand:+ start:8126 stop:9133 length:1008 start_codon:yes stop_codon:yes gene_type:complete